jgi:DNA repair protein RadC
MKNNFNQNIAEVQITYSHTIKPSEQVKITSSSDVYNLVKDLWMESIDYRESFAILLLSRANRVLGFTLVSLGGISGVSVDVRTIFQAALKSNSSHIIALHNHPSGHLKPSDADDKITKNLVEAGKLLDINFVDHLIITSEGFYSYADEGRL